MPDRSIAILDVGHGNCSVIKDADHIFIIDTGPGSALLEFLKYENIQSIEAIFISHADSDHISGLLSLLSSQTISIGSVWLNTDSIKESNIWDDLLYELGQAENKEKIKLNVSLTRSPGDVFQCGLTQLEILAPCSYIAGRGPGSTDRKNRKIRSNTISAVIKLTTDGNPLALLPGDIDDVGLDNLIETVQPFKADILVFPHHGGRPGSGSIVDFTKKICANVSPKIIIFSIGRGHHHTPHPDIIRTIRSELPETVILCSQISEHCEKDLCQKKPTHLSETFSQGREKLNCCAGTIIVDLDNPTTTYPTLDDHQQFIASCSGPPLCLA